jgi:hypothetical protein
LYEQHLTGWVRRMMRLRLDKLARKGTSGLNWTILPPSFQDELCVHTYEKPIKYGNGKDELYPPFWEVKYVYFPLQIPVLDDWMLVRIDLDTMEMVQYWSNNIYRELYQDLIYNKVIRPVQWGFDSLLHQICYWRKKYYDPLLIKANQKELTHVICDDYLPKDDVELGGDLGVLACMLMQMLVQGKTVVIDEGFKDKCGSYRKFMAKEFYQYRFEN